MTDHQSNLPSSQPQLFIGNRVIKAPSGAWTIHPDELCYCCVVLMAHGHNKRSTLLAHILSTAHINALVKRRNRERNHG